MARIEYIEHRLRNWARWVCMLGTSSGSLASVDLTQERVDKSSGGYDANTVVPIDDAEATQTQKAVSSLVDELRRTVEVVYVETSSAGKAARKLQVAEATVHARVERAHYRLQEWFSAHDEAARRERERVEALQASIRPRGF